MSDSEPSIIILDRLLEFVGPEDDPWGVEPIMEFIGTIEGTDSKFDHNEWNREWSKERHVKRIQYFLTSPELDIPIEIDCLCTNNAILPIPTILDGWHRLHAHVHLGRKTILANFGGLVDLLEYLTGERDDCPES